MTISRVTAIPCGLARERVDQRSQPSAFGFGERAARVDHIVGPLPLFILRHLPGKDGVELFHGHAGPGQRALALIASSDATVTATRSRP